MQYPGFEHVSWYANISFWPINYDCFPDQLAQYVFLLKCLNYYLYIKLNASLGMILKEFQILMQESIQQMFDKQHHV